jgi:hypothetical protein
MVLAMPRMPRSSPPLMLHAERMDAAGRNDLHEGENLQRRGTAKRCCWVAMACMRARWQAPPHAPRYQARSPLRPAVTPPARQERVQRAARKRKLVPPMLREQRY